MLFFDHVFKVVIFCTLISLYEESFPVRTHCCQMLPSLPLPELARLNCIPVANIHIHINKVFTTFLYPFCLMSSIFKLPTAFVIFSVTFVSLLFRFISLICVWIFLKILPLLAFNKAAGGQDYVFRIFIA